MQDGATAHTTNNLLGEKFGGWVISQRSEIEWPPYSPDSNPLDYFFWSLAMIQVGCHNTSTIAELTAIVEDVATTAPKEMIRDAVGNIRKCCQAYQMVEGGHFEPFFKKI